MTFHCDEIEKMLRDSDIPLSRILSDLYSNMSGSDSSELSSFVKKEYSGYSIEDSIPSYRIVKSDQLRIDGFVPYQGAVSKFIDLPSIGLESALDDISKMPVRISIADLEAIIADLREVYVPLSNEYYPLIQKYIAVNGEIDNAWLKVPVDRLAKLVGIVRNNLLDSLTGSVNDEKGGARPLDIFNGSAYSISSSDNDLSKVIYSFDDVS